MTRPIRILALEHFSAMDLAALEEAGDKSFAWRRIPYWRFRDAANQILPASVQSGLEDFAKPEHEAQRSAYIKWCRRELAHLYREWPFDMLVLPSDTFYYVRALPLLCHEIGVPVVVSQKETTISERFMREHTGEIAEWAPFISDRMTVSSERHREFWIRSGANPDLLEVTGQPRFDLYASAPTGLAWNWLGIDDAAFTVLYLSYDKTAYLLNSPLDWSALRTETEDALAEASGRFALRLLIKLHPLQDYEREAEELARIPGLGTSVQLLPSDTDTRLLLILAQAVVGFQSTGLLEAMAAGKPIAYAGWGDLHAEIADDLIPYGSHPELLHVATGGEDLIAWLASQPSVADGTRLPRKQFVESFLGPIDGLASQRTLEVFRQVDRDWAERRSQSKRRALLDRRHRVTAPLHTLGDVVRSLGWQTVAAVAHLAPSSVRQRALAKCAFVLGPINERLAAARDR